MQFAVSIVIVGLLYLGLFHTKINQWALVVGAVLTSTIAETAVAGDISTVGLVVKYLLLFVVFVVGLAARNVDAVTTDLDDLSADPTMIRADGVALAAQLEAAGFERAPEGWLHFPRNGWDALALRQGPVNAFMVSGDRGPLVEFTSGLDDGSIVMTVSTARTPVLPRYLRQCFPGQDVEVRPHAHRGARRWCTPPRPSGRGDAARTPATGPRRRIDHRPTRGGQQTAGQSGFLALVEVCGDLDGDGSHVRSQ